MISTNALYAFASQRGHAVYSRDLRHMPSLSVQLPDGSCAIGMRRSGLSPRQERVCLAHELGHCETGAFYTRYSAVDNRDKCEQMAQRWAIQVLVPLDELKRQLQAGLREPWQLAEYFQVPEWMILQAAAYYLEALGKSLDSDATAP